MKQIPFTIRNPTWELVKALTGLQGRFNAEQWREFPPESIQLGSWSMSGTKIEGALLTGHSRFHRTRDVEFPVFATGSFWLLDIAELGEPVEVPETPSQYINN